MPAVLRVPSTDNPETLPPDRNLAEFYNASPKIRGQSRKKIPGLKICKISVDFGPLQTLIANISETGQHIQNRKTLQTMAIPPAFDEKRPVNFGPLTTWNFVSLDPQIRTFGEDYILAHTRCCALKFLHALEIDQALIAHTRSGTGVPSKNSNWENLKFGLKFSVLATITSGQV